MSQTVYLVKQWGIEYSKVYGVYGSERGAVQAVRRRLFSNDSVVLEGAVQRSQRRRVWRSRRQATARRWVGARTWRRYRLDGVKRYLRPVPDCQNLVPTLMWSARESPCNDHLGVFPYRVEEAL